MAHSNTGDGFSSDSSTIFIGCIAYGNGTYQFEANAALMYRCLGYGVSLTNGTVKEGGGLYLIGNTLDAEGVTGSEGFGLMNNSANLIICDNIIYDAGGTGVADMSATPNLSQNYFIGYNLLNSNTTDYSQTFTSPTFGYQDVTSAPAFTEEATDDYTLGEASPAIGAGLTPGGIT